MANLDEAVKGREKEIPALTGELADSIESLASKVEKLQGQLTAFRSDSEDDIFKGDSRVIKTVYGETLSFYITRIQTINQLVGKIQDELEV